MTTGPRSVRLTDEAWRRLRSSGERRGLKPSAMAALLVEEGLRMAEHPGVVFRDGASGRRAVVAGGPDVWEIIRAVKEERRRGPDLAESELFGQVGRNAGVALRHLRIAVDYWAAYPDEIDTWIEDAITAEHEFEARMRRRTGLLTG